jgi:hypothetical protein
MRVQLWTSEIWRLRIKWYDHSRKVQHSKVRTPLTDTLLALLLSLYTKTYGYFTRCLCAWSHSDYKQLTILMKYEIKHTPYEVMTLQYAIPTPRSCSRKRSSRSHPELLLIERTPSHRTYPSSTGQVFQPVFYVQHFRLKFRMHFLYCLHTTRPAHFILLDSYIRMLPSE